MKSEMEAEMKIENTKFCNCEEPEIDVTLKNFVFYLCKKCQGAVKRKEHICAYYLSQGYCQLTQQKFYTYICSLKGDFTKCKSGHKE